MARPTITSKMLTLLGSWRFLQRYLRGLLAAKPQALLVSAAFLQLFCYVMIAIDSGQFVHGEGFTQRPLLRVVGLFELAFLGYLASVAMIWRQDSRGLLWIIIPFAIAFRLVQLFAVPIQEIDIYRYLWDGRVLATGHNPFTYSPQEIELAIPGAATTELRSLHSLSTSTPALRTIFDRIHFRSVPTVYPAVSQVVFAFVARLTPPEAALETHLLVMKGVLTAFDLATVGVLVLLLRRLGRPLALCITYAWCPLVIKEFANSGHLDSIAVFLLMAAVYLTVRALHAQNRPVASMAFDSAAACCWGLAILAKFFPVVLAPLLASWWWRRHRYRCLLPLVIAGLLIITIQSAFSPETSKDRSLEGLGVFLSYWEMNDLAFAVVIENLDPYSSPEPAAWFSILPTSWRLALVGPCQDFAERVVGWKLDDLGVAFLLARLGTMLVYGGIVLYLISRSWSLRAEQDLLNNMFLMLAWFWMLIPTQNPWYWTWALPLVAFASWPWLLVSGAALLYYLRFWFEYHFADQAVWPTPYSGAAFFDYVVVWVEHLPILLILLWASRQAGAAAASNHERPQHQSIELGSTSTAYSASSGNTRLSSTRSSSPQ